MAEGAVELQIVAGNEDDKEKWDYVLMMNPIKPPKDKEGNQLPEDNAKVGKFREVEKQREEVIAALKDPHVGLKVEVRDGSDGDTRYVLLKATEERLYDQAEAIELKMKLKPEYGGGYAPYTSEHKDLFQPASKEQFFSESQRMNLVKSIIQGDQDVGGAGQNINALIRLGICNKVFPLHNHEERRFLKENWADLRKFWKFQPIDAIRNYYGEEIAIYFAWLGFYTQWLFIASAVGLVTFIIWISVYLENKAEAEEEAEETGTEVQPEEGWSTWVITVYSVFIMIWATVFMEFWKRYNHELAFRWGVTDFEATEEQRVDFQGLPEDGAYVNGEWVPFDKENEQAQIEIPKSKYYPDFLRKGKIAAALPLLFSMLIVVCIATASILSFRLFLQKTFNPNRDNEGGSIGGSIVGAFANSIIIISMNVFWRIVADRLTRWENHRTQTEFDDALTFKIFLFQFVNSYTSLYYIAFFKATVDFWGARQLEDDCKFGPRPWDENGDRRIVGWGCVIELTVQLATLLGTNMFIGQTREVAIPFIVSAIQLRALKKKAAAEGESKPLPQYERDGKLAPFMGTFDEYSEMVIQFGYITLFAAAFPLAPVMALMNNLVEIRTDAIKLLDATVRPHYKGGQDIGSWYNILEFLGIISVLTNCALLAFTYSSIYDLYDGSSADDRKFQVFATAVILEHVMLVLKYGLAEIIPDVPGWVRREMAKSDYIKEQTFKQIALKKAGEKKVYQVKD